MADATGVVCASESQQEVEVRTAFNMFDADGSGTLTTDELQRALQILEVAMSREEVELLVDEIDTSGDGEISCDELLQFVYDNTGGNAQTERERKELQDVFSLIDADGSGLLSADELHRALKILGVSMSREEVKLLMTEIDGNGDGEISFDELFAYVQRFDDGATQDGRNGSTDVDKVQLH